MNDVSIFPLFRSLLFIISQDLIFANFYKPFFNSHSALLKIVLDNLERELYR
jgi:hypothetical protein